MCFGNYSLALERYENALLYKFFDLMTKSKELLSIVMFKAGFEF